MSPRARLLLIGVLLLIPFVVPVPDTLERMRALRSLGVLAHFILPAGLALLFYRHGPLSGSVLKAGAAAFVLSAGAELAQAFVGRSPRIQDALVDLAGVLTSAGLVVWRRDGRRVALAWALAGFAILGVKMHRLPAFVLAERAAAARMPLVADFETRLEMALLDKNSGMRGKLSRVEEAELHGHVLEIEGRRGKRPPGVIIRGLPRDWSGYRTLSFRARLVEGDPCRINVRLDDFDSRDDAVFAGGGFELGRHWQAHSLNLAEAAAGASRPFRLDDIDSLLLYLGGAREDVRVRIDDIILE